MTYVPNSDTTISASMTAGNLVIEVPTVGKGSVALRITGSVGTGTINFEMTVDGTNWVPASSIDMLAFTNAAATSMVAATGGYFAFNVAGCKKFRVRGVGISGTIPITINATANSAVMLGTIATSYVGQAGAPWSITDTASASIASSTVGQKGSLVLGAATTAAPSYSTAQSNPISLTLGGGVRVDNTTIAGTAMSVNAGTADAGCQRVAIVTNSAMNVGQINAVTPLMGNGVTGTGSLRVTPVSDATTNTNTYATRADTFTTAVAGTTVTNLAKPMSKFSMQAAVTGAVTSWNIVLEGSNNNTTFFTIMTLDSVADASALLKFSGANSYPCLYVRSRCTAIALGAGTNVIATILAMV